METDIQEEDIQQRYETISKAREAFSFHKKADKFELTAEELCNRKAEDVGMMTGAASDMDRCMDYLMQMRRMNQLFQKQCQAPLGEVTVLLGIQQMFDQNQSVNVSGLGDRLHLSRPAVSRMMQNLKRKGYIELHPGKKDHRYIYIELTDIGRRLIKKEMDNCIALLKRASERMGKEEMERYINYSRKFSSLLMEEKTGTGHQ